MPITFACPGCAKTLQVADEFAGRRVRCGGCKSVVSVPGPGVPPPVSVAPSPPELVQPPRPVPPPPLPMPHAAPQFPPAAPPVLAPAIEFWTAPPLKNRGELLILDPEGVWWVPGTPAEAEEDAEQLAAGAEPAILFANRPVAHFTYDQFNQARLDRQAKSLWLEWQAAPKQKLPWDVPFIDAGARDQVYAALRQRLGRGWRERVREFTPLRAAIAPVVWIIVTLAATLILAILAGAITRDGARYEGRGRGSWVIYLGQWVLGVLGPWGTLLVGAVATGLLGWWLVRRLQSPPIYVELKPAPDGRDE